METYRERHPGVWAPFVLVGEGAQISNAQGVLSTVARAHSSAEANFRSSVDSWHTGERLSTGGSGQLYFRPEPCGTDVHRSWSLLIHRAGAAFLTPFAG